MKCKYEGSGVWEGRCVGTKEVDPCVGIGKCDRYKPDCLTNADRIRSMSDEELCEMLTAGTGGFDCGVCREKSEWNCDCDCGRHCADWLKTTYEGR